MSDRSRALVADSLTIVVNKVGLLENISFAVSAGEVLGVIGPNGAGKTTLLRALMGDIAPRQGSIVIHEQLLQQWSERELACRLASLPQQSSLNFPFTVAEVVGLSRLPHASGRALDGEIVATVMARLDIHHLAARKYTQLSGGEKQRVQLARVIAQLLPLTDSPTKLLLLDEPCSGLDLKHQKILADYLVELARRKVAVIVTAHDLNWLISLSNRILGLKNGKQAFLGAVNEIMQADKLEALFDVPMQVYRNPLQSTTMIGLR